MLFPNRYLVLTISRTHQISSHLYLSSGLGPMSRAADKSIRTVAFGGQSVKSKSNNRFDSYQWLVN